MAESILKIDKVGFKAGDQTILKEITFDVQKGEKIIVSGPSGSGKSTLLKLIATLNTHTSGEIYFNQKPIYDFDLMEYRKQVSYFFQNALLFDQTVRDNLAFPYIIRGEDYDEDRLKSSLGKVQLPNTYLDKPIKELSGGEKQRVAFMRNLQYEPKILLLDEVTSSLDAQNRRIIHDLISEMNRQSEKTILMVTHNEQEITEASRIITIEDGEVKE